MRVLICHNRYSSAAPSGENLVVEEEVELLQSAGVDVSLYTASSDTLARAADTATWLRAAAVPVYSPAADKRFASALAREQPDIVHVHNVYPLLGPGIVAVAKDRGLPVVQTVHNYRHACVNGLLFRDGAPCTRCVGRRVPLPALTGPCYRGSLPQTAVMVTSLAVHRRTWRRADAFCVLSPFMQQQLSAAGVPHDRFLLRPTWCHGPEEVRQGGPVVLFVGRLDHYKGLTLLIDGWRRSVLKDRGWTLRIAGDGELREDVHAAASSVPGVEYLGRIQGHALEQAYSECSAVAIPSLLYEGLPRVFSEALAHGRPVLVNDFGSMASMISEGMGRSVDATPAGWAQALDELAAVDAPDRTAAARSFWRERLSPVAARDSLLDLYARLTSGQGPTP